MVDDKNRPDVGPPPRSWWARLEALERQARRVPQLEAMIAELRNRLYAIHHRVDTVEDQAERRDRHRRPHGDGRPEISLAGWERLVHYRRSRR